MDARLGPDRAPVPWLPEAALAGLDKWKCAPSSRVTDPSDGAMKQDLLAAPEGTGGKPRQVRHGGDGQRVAAIVCRTSAP